ncbi:MAG: hypothetical protein ACJ78Q_09330, partial [Chloroflexia bacterium]
MPSYRGYDYLGQIIASWGYIVVSASANGINAIDNSSAFFGMQARAELVQAHLNQWNTYNTTGGTPFGSQFVGKVDLTRVGTMGHSRGGEGVVRNFNYNASLGSPYGIKAVIPLAPTNFYRTVINNVALGLILPYCDGDVNNLQGIHYYDDARYNVPGDSAPKHSFLVMGANHNYFNTYWSSSSSLTGGADDWNDYTHTPARAPDGFCGRFVSGNHRLSEAQEQGTGVAYMTGFFRTYVGSDTAFYSMMVGDTPPPPSAMTSEIYPSFQASNNPARRRDVNRLLDSTNLTTNTLGGAATQSGMTPYDLCGGLSPQPQHCYTDSSGTARQSHTDPAPIATSVRGLSQLRAGWSGTTNAFVRNDIPAGSRDVSGFEALQFRVAMPPNFYDPRNPTNIPLDFSVVMTDGTGTADSVSVGAVSRALYYPPGTIYEVPHLILNTVRVPLGAFYGLNLGDIRAIEFRFDQRSTGALLFSDIAFASIGLTVTPTPTGTPPTRTPSLTRTATSTPTPTACGTSGGYVVNQSTGASIDPGTTDIGNHTDDGLTTIALPFPYQLYGTTYNSAQAGSNGALFFGTANSTYQVTCLPNSLGTIVIAPYWADQCTGACGASTCTGCGIFTSTSGSSPNRIFNIEYRTNYYNTNTALDYEVRLYEGQSRFDVVYGTVSSLASANDSQLTVGVERDPTFFTAFGCDTSGGQVPPVSAGQQLAFTQPSCGTSTPSSTLTVTPTATDTPTPCPSCTVTATPTQTLTPTSTPCVPATNYSFSTSSGAAIVPGTTDIGNHSDDG